jgi:hypothetical protein
MAAHMSTKLLPRAKVRLRLDRGTALLKQFGASVLTCTILDISEGGCQCRISLDEVDNETAESWQQILSPGRLLMLELTEPPELRALQSAEAEVRWMHPNKHGYIDFGMALRDLTREQLNVLQRAMLSLASNKLRGRKLTEAELKLSNASRVANIAPAREAGAKTKSGRHATASRLIAFEESVPTQEARTSGLHAVRRPQSGMYPHASESGTFRRPGSDANLPSTTPPPTEAAILEREMQALERQKRHALQLGITFQFCDSTRTLLDTEIYYGRTVDFNEGGFLLEGPPSDFCDPLQLPSREVKMLAKLASTPQEIACLLHIRSVRQGTLGPDVYQYGVQIAEIADEDRRALREMYIRAGLTTLFRR